jgi:hypothetical protein
MGRLARGLQLSLRCGLELAKSFAESRLAEFPIYERGLHANGPRRILEDETVAMRTSHDTETAADVVHIIPSP